MQLRLLPIAEEAAERFYLVTGAMRTGSTMLGRLLRSLRNFEVFHEPAVAYTLFPLIEAMDNRHWKLLFTSCVFEDCLIASLAGTSLNMNRYNESFIFHSDTFAGYKGKVSHTNNHEDLVELSKTKLVAVKIPEMMPYVERYKRLFPHNKIFITLRQPEAVIASLIVKGYYSDRRTHTFPKKWPNRVGPNETFLPFWLEDNCVDRWLASSEADRCCLSYIAQYKKCNVNLTDAFIDYDQLCLNPQTYFYNLAELHNWQYGEKTEQLLREVKPSQAAERFDSGIISPDLLAEARELHSRLQELSDLTV